jgi:predicted dehydrogenase
MNPVTVLIVGAGGRGNAYSSFAEKFPDKAKVVGVAEPRDWYREDLARRHGIPEENIFTDWKAAAERERFADAVVVATQDAMHVDPAVAFAQKGYHMLLEKPMAPDAEGCRTIVDAVLDAGIIFAVGHVLRYTAYTRTMKKLVSEGRIGEVVSIEHLEPVGFWHQAHSFVRGNWRNEEESSSMLLAKSCHDIDWLRHIVGKPCKQVSSFGSLKHFRREEMPEGAAERCLDCDVEAECPYSAKKLYLDAAHDGRTGWPLDVLVPEVNPETIAQALRDGPYGRCVYACDNDVIDHQVVILEYEGSTTASFTMTAFNKGSGRKTRIFGTHGEIEGDSSEIKLFDFRTKEWEAIDTNAADASITGGHGGGDFGLMGSFIEAVATNDTSKILSGPQETLESHLTVFAAEEARKAGKVVAV